MGKITKPNVEIIPVTGSSSSGSGHQKQKSFKMPYMSDPTIVPRVQKYLESNAEKTYVDIDQIADELQSKYREYARRKRSAFRASVKKAYSLVLQSYGLEDKETSEDELLSDDTEQESEGDGKYNDNNSMIDIYQRRAANKTLEMSENELIDISSEDSEEEAAYNIKSNGAAAATPSTSQSKSVIVQGDTIDKSAHKAYEKQTIDYSSIERGKKRKLDVTIAPIKEYQPALKKKKVTPASPAIQKSSYTFKNIGGMDNVLITITKFLIHMKNPEGHRKLGLQPPNALLLHGPSGCGKSLLAAAIAGELNIPLIKVNGTELIAGISGESEERIRELFERAYNTAPCVLFFDRIDSITPSRENTQREMAKRIVSQMLSCLDELHMSENGCQVCVIGATTRLEAIDPELRRQGRFDKEISLGIPDIKSREGILKVITKQTPLAADVDLAKVATFTPGYVAADLNLLIREASESALERLFAMMEKFHANQSAMQQKSPNSTQQNTETQKEQEVSTAEKDEEIIVDDDLSKPQASKGESTSEAIVVVDDGEESQSKELDTKEVPADTTKIEQENKFPQESTSLGIEDADIIVEDEPQLAQEPMPVDEIESGNLLEELLTILKKSDLYNEAILQNINISMDDIERALKKIQPTTKKEGFATVPDTTWDDIGSLKDIREELQLSILAHIKYPERVKEFCLDVPCGILLCGPPGCGKTLLAKAIANEAGINFISVQGPELLKMYVGESERGVRTCFQRARDSAPCVIFFDEFDALCPSRSSSDGGSVTNRIVNQMLTEMSGIGNRDGVFLLAASNRPEMIDPAILRPGRLDKIIYVGLPTREDRVEILRAITKNGTKPKLDDDVDLTNIASLEEVSGYTGADLKGLVMQASRAALKEYVLTDKVRVVSNRHFLQAVKKMRPSVSEKDKKHYEKLRRLYTNVSHEEEVEEMEYS